MNLREKSLSIVNKCLDNEVQVSVYRCDMGYSITIGVQHEITLSECSVDYYDGADWVEIEFDKVDAIVNDLLDIIK